ncbi:MAG TPA: methylamine utilization protein [Rhodanobacteraceae bacterium]|nr:methylamine utilization protein [Rhodanobacteraceae bacterium]
MRTAYWLTLVAALALGATARAGGLQVSLLDQQGKPVPDAVVTLLPQNAAPAPAHPSAVKVIDQKNLTFIPYIEIFRPGDSVVFRNSDDTRHHVYSFSPAKAFEFVLAPGESSAPLILDKTGVIAVGCNIHDQMIAYLYVSGAPWIAHSGTDGTVKFGDLPAGTYTVRVWQPRLKPSQPDLAQSVTVVGTGSAQTLKFDLSLLPDPRLQFDREHTSY